LRSFTDMTMHNSLFYGALNLTGAV
jgi:hypothetical protein